MNRIDVLKAARPAWLFVLVNDVEGVRLFRGQYLPRRARAQARLEEVRVDSGIFM